MRLFAVLSGYRRCPRLPPPLQGVGWGGRHPWNRRTPPKQGLGDPVPPELRPTTAALPNRRPANWSSALACRGRPLNRRSTPGSADRHSPRPVRALAGFDCRGQRVSALTVGERVRRLRVLRGLAQWELAQFAGKSERWVRYLENSDARLDSQTAELLANGLRVGIDVVLGLVPIPASLQGDPEVVVPPGHVSPTAPASYSDAMVEASQHDWRLVRRHLAAHASELTALAADLYPQHDRLGSTALLTSRNWMAIEPVDLNDLELDWLGGPQRRLVDGTEPEAQRLLPLRAPGRPFERYSTAVRYLDRPGLFENRPTYRLLRVSRYERLVRLGFSLGTYFELVDVGQAAAHELAAGHMHWGRRPSMDQLPFRSLIGDPFDLPRRPVQAALDVLTLRWNRRSGSASFFLHWRDPTKVAVGGGLYSTIPVGVFQPSSIAPEAQHQDFDLWRNLVREFSEELLGMPEHDGSSGALIDYQRWELFRRLTHACATRSVRVFCFGIGLDRRSRGRGHRKRHIR